MKNYTPIVEHEILRTLKNAAVTVRQHGSQEDGYTPIDKLILRSAHLHYGTLVALINDNQILKDADFGYMGVKVKRNDVSITKFSWDQVADGLQILEANKHISEKNRVELNGIEDRVIYLTKEGLNAYLRLDYERNWILQKLEEQVRSSTLEANKNTIRLGWVTCVVAVSSAVISLIQLIKTDEVSIPQLNTLIQKIDTLSLNRKNEYLKHSNNNHLRQLSLSKSLLKEKQ